MRMINSIFLVALITPSLAAQQPVKSSPTIDAILREWEKTVTGLDSFSCEIHRQCLDKALGASDEFRGSAAFAKSKKKENGNLARLHMIKDGNGNVFEKYICTGPELFEYVPANKLIRVHKVPNAKQVGLPQDNLLAFLFGMGADHIKSRYHLELVNADNPHYYTIRLKPKSDKDAVDFTLAQLVLYRSNCMPAQIWYLQPNKNETTWNFTKLQLNAGMPANQFEPDVPQGWQVVRVAPPPALPQKKQ